MDQAFNQFFLPTSLVLHASASSAVKYYKGLWTISPCSVKSVQMDSLNSPLHCRDWRVFCAKGSKSWCLEWRLLIWKTLDGVNKESGCTLIAGICPEMATRWVPWRSRGVGRLTPQPWWAIQSETMARDGKSEMEKTELLAIPGCRPPLVLPALPISSWVAWLWEEAAAARKTRGEHLN